jgi:hypothetical protein
VKHVVKYLNDPNEPIIFNHFVLQNYSYDSFFGNHTIEISPHAESATQSEILHCTQVVETNYDIIDRIVTNSNVQNNILSRSKLEVYPNSTNLKKS